MQGKSCFNFNMVNEPLLGELEALVRTGYERTAGNPSWGAAQRVSEAWATAMRAPGSRPSAADLPDSHGRKRRGPVGRLAPDKVAGDEGKAGHDDREHAQGQASNKQLLTSLADPAPIAYAVLSLTVIRMVPVAIALLGLRFRWMTVLFIGWFGPRGLASVVFLFIGLAGLHESGIDPGPLPAVVAWTVLLSIIAHGLSAGPIAARYGRRAKLLEEGAPELKDAAEPRPARTSWAGMEPT